MADRDEQTPTGLPFLRNKGASPPPETPRRLLQLPFFRTRADRLNQEPAASKPRRDHKKRNIMFVVLAGTLLIVEQIHERGQAQSPTSGDIVAYTLMLPEHVETYLSFFNAQYPAIEVTVVRDSSSRLIERLLAQAEDPEADVLWGMSATSVVFAQWNDLLAQYAPTGLDRVRIQFRDVNDPPYWIGFDGWMVALCVNTEVLHKRDLPIPESLHDLTKPIYAGQLAMPSPLETGTGYMAISTILQLEGEVGGWEFLNALDQNVAQYAQGAEQACQIAMEGQIPIAVSYGLEGISRKTEGAPIDVIFPVEGSAWDMEANALIRKAAIKPAAKTFLDWTLSETAMNLYAENYAFTAAETATPPRQGFPENPIQQLIDRDFPWATANRERILYEWETRYGTERLVKKADSAPQIIQSSEIPPLAAESEGGEQSEEDEAIESAPEEPSALPEDIGTRDSEAPESAELSSVPEPEPPSIIQQAVKTLREAIWPADKSAEDRAPESTAPSADPEAFAPSESPASEGQQAVTEENEPHEPADPEGRSQFEQLPSPDSGPEVYEAVEALLATMLPTEEEADQAPPE